MEGRGARRGPGLGRLFSGVASAKARGAAIGQRGPAEAALQPSRALGRGRGSVGRGLDRAGAARGRMQMSSWAGPPRLWAARPIRSAPRLTPAYIQRARPGRAAPRAHPPAAAHDFQRDRHARRGEGRPRRAHGLAAAPAVAHAQPRDQVHQGKAVLRTLSRSFLWISSRLGPGGPLSSPAPPGETALRTSEVAPRLGERLWGTGPRPEGSAGITSGGGRW